MALDPSIITSGQPVKLPTLGDLVALQGTQQSNQLNAMKLQQGQRGLRAQSTLADLYRQNTGPDGTVNMGGVSQGMAAAGFGEQVPELQKTQQELQQGQTTNDAASFALKKQKVDTINQSLASLLADPNTTPDSVVKHISSWVDQGLIDPNTGAQMVQKVPGPQGLRGWLVQAALQGQSVDKQLSAMAPTDKTLDKGGSIGQYQAPSEVTRLVNPNAPALTPSGPDIGKTMTPDEAAKIKLIQSGALTPEAINLAAQRIANGEKSSVVLANFGRGQQGATAIASVQNRLAQMASDPSSGFNAKDLASRQQDLAGYNKQNQVLSAREGNISAKVIEGQKFAQLALTASDNVPRGNWSGLNTLLQAGAKQASDPNLARFQAANTSLINAYSAAVNGGTPTVSGQEHARDMLATAAGPEAYKATVQQLLTEMAAAKASPEQARTDLRATVTGTDGTANTAPLAGPVPVGQPQKIGGFTVTRVK